MPKDTGELIFKKSINLCCQPIFSYISSFVIAPNAPFPRACHICSDHDFTLKCTLNSLPGMVGQCDPVAMTAFDLTVTTV